MTSTSISHEHVRVAVDVVECWAGIFVTRVGLSVCLLRLDMTYMMIVMMDEYKDEEELI